MTESFPSPRPGAGSDPAEPPDPPHSPVVPVQLKGRMLLQAGVSRVGYIREQLDPVRSGLVVSGPGAAAKVRKLREEGFTGPLLADPAVYTVAAASEDDPFPDISKGQLAFGDPLQLSMEEQVGHRAGATAAMTPTGYLH